MESVNVVIFADEERIGQKRRKKITHFNNFFSEGGNGGSGGAGGAGAGFFRGGRLYPLSYGNSLLMIFCLVRFQWFWWRCWWWGGRVRRWEWL